MVKRYTCTDKWKKTFMKRLSKELKLLWLYILDDCNHAGIWHVDFEIASIRIGSEIDAKEAREALAGKYHEFDNGEKWFIPTFLEFQNVKLNPANRAHKSALDILEKYNLTHMISDIIIGPEGATQAPSDAPSDGASHDPYTNGDVAPKTAENKSIKEVITPYEARNWANKYAKNQVKWGHIPKEVWAAMKEFGIEQFKGDEKKVSIGLTEFRKFWEEQAQKLGNILKRK